MKHVWLMTFLAAAAGWAQDKRPAFEAATVKVSNEPTRGSQTHGSEGQVLMRNQTLRRLVERAYGVQPFQIIGPGWMDDVRFDVAAKFPDGTKNEDRPLMMRTLLEDRFKLAAHQETKDLPGYELVVAKGGFKLKPVKNTGGSDMRTYGGLVQTVTVKRVSIAQVADLLSSELGTLVLDRTGIAGVYDFEFKWTNAEQAGTDADAVPSLFTAVEETVGVRLKAGKVPTPVVVVDHVERIPIEN